MLQKDLLGFPTHKFKNLKAPWICLFGLLHHGGDFDLSALPVMSKSQARYCLVPKTLGKHSYQGVDSQSIKSSHAFNPNIWESEAHWCLDLWVLRTTQTNLVSKDPKKGIKSVYTWHLI